jgi:hypothetical protein
LAANDAVTAREAYDIKYAAKAATGLIMAFLEVVPRVVVHDEFTDPNPDIAELAHGSIGLILGWLSLSQATDAGLTYALMRPKPRRQTVGLEDFYNMRYSPKWFTRQAGSIVLRPEKVPDMRNDANRHPAIADHPKDVIFGCPARSHVPRLYRAMVAKAMHDDLFGPTYLRERMNTGYGPA